MDELVRAMAAAADPLRAATMERYFQVRPGGYGDGDEFIGLSMPTLRALARPYAASVVDPGAWLSLLRSPIHEHRLLCLIVFAERATRAARSPTGDEELGSIYTTYLANTAHVNNWDLVDVSCGPILGHYLRHRDRDPLYRLARSDFVWERRIAMVGSQQFLRFGETDDLFRLAALLVHDRHDLIQKAVGWSLREAAKRLDPQLLRDFLDEYAATMPRTALRYAIEHFSDRDRRHYLGLR